MSSNLAGRTSLNHLLTQISNSRYDSLSGVAVFIHSFSSDYFVLLAVLIVKLVVNGAAVLMDDLRKEDKSLSSLAGLGIALVVLGHSVPFPGKIPMLVETSYAARVYFGIIGWIYTFHMPLFFYMAGYSLIRFSIANRVSLATFMRKKAARLLIPYVVLSSVAFPIKVLLSRYALRPTPFQWTAFFHQLLFPWTNVVIFFWFLPTIFLAFVISYFLLSQGEGRTKMIVVMSCAVVASCSFHHNNTTGWQAFLNIGGCFHNFVYFWLGVMTARFKWESLITKAGYPAILLSVLLYTSVPVGIRDSSNALNLILAALGIAGSWSITHRSYVGVFDYLGNYSYSIFLLSWFPQMFFRVLVDQVLHANLQYLVFATLVSGLLFPVLVVILLKKVEIPIIRYSCGLQVSSVSLPKLVTQPG